MSDICVADGASAWFGGFARGANADCDKAMFMLAITGVVMAILYAMCAVYHARLLWKNNALSMVAVVCAGLTSVIGYCIQAAVYWSPLYDVNGGPSGALAGATFVLQESPMLIGGYIFWILHRTVSYSRTEAILWTSTWLVGILILFGYCVQIIAIGMVTSRTNSSRSGSGLSVDGGALVGERIWTATLAAQAIAVVLLFCNAVQMYTTRAKASIVPADKVREMRLFLLCVIGALLLLFVRTIFRAATTVFAANHAYDILTTYGTLPGEKLSPEGEGSTYTTIAWLNFGLDGLPVLFALVTLAIVPVTRFVPATLFPVLASSAPARSASTRPSRPYQARPTVRVSATFDAARPQAARTARAVIRNQSSATTEAPAPQPIQSIEMREQAIVAGEQPNLRELPPAYDAAPAYEERAKPAEGERGVLDGMR